jgi:anti-sigma B factor antagonist
MKMTEENLGGQVTRIALEGRLDIEGTQQVENQFSYSTTVRAGQFAVDLSGVTFLASIGIRMLITAARAQTQRGGRMILVSPDGMTRKVLETAGIDQLIAIVADLDAARSTLGAS